MAHRGTQQMVHLPQIPSPFSRVPSNNPAAHQSGDPGDDAPYVRSAPCLLPPEALCIHEVSSGLQPSPPPLSPQLTPASNTEIVIHIIWGEVCS